MKVRITLKDPDGVQDSLDATTKASLDGQGLSREEREAVYELRREALDAKVKPWIRYGEYVTIEIDTDANTAIVVANDRD